MGPENRVKTLVDRVGDELTREVDRWELKTREARRRGLELFSKPIDAPPADEPAPAPLARSLTRREQRELRRKEERESATTGGGLVTLGLAAAVLVFAFVYPALWWLIFAAAGMARKGVQLLGWAAQRERQSQPLPVIEPARRAPSEVDLACDQLLAELAASPEAVRDFLQDPKETVESLRSAARSLDQRRQQLAAEQYPAKLSALEGQRTELLARREKTVDPLARTRLNSAVESLDGQVSAVKQLVANAERVEGEYTSLLVLLQELRTRVSVARASSAAVPLGALHENVARLNDELEAISGALESTPQVPVR